MPEIRTVAIIGAGTIGREIAYLAALGGYRTILEDILPATLRKAESELRAHLDRAVESGGLSPDEADAAFQRLEYGSSVDEAAREADLVIETVPEEWESKLEIFTLLDKICKPHTIFASHTSAFTIADLGSVTYRTQKILGMRFPAPLHSTKRLELVRTEDTDDETILACAEVGRRMGTEVVVIRETTLSNAAQNC
jgi:3-hydroxybutyryl-CoA dehydrogenase